MSQEFSEMPKTSFCRIQDIIAILAGPRDWNETRTRWLDRAAIAAGIIDENGNPAHRQIHAIWYGEVTDEEHRNIRRLRAAADAKRIKDAAEQLERIAQEIGPWLDRERIDLLLDTAGRIRAMGSQAKTWGR